MLGGPADLLAASVAPSWQRRHTGAPGWVGPGLGGEGREAHLPGFKKPQRAGEGWAPTVHLHPVRCAACKPRPRGTTGTHPRSRSEPGPGGGLPVLPEPAPGGGGWGGERALPRSRAAERAPRGGAVVCRASGRGPPARSPAAPQQLPQPEVISAPRWEQGRAGARGTGPGLQGRRRSGPGARECPRGAPRGVGRPALQLEQLPLVKNTPAPPLPSSPPLGALRFPPQPSHPDRRWPLSGDSSAFD